MVRLVEIVAPQTWGEAVRNGLVFLALILVTDLLTTTALGVVVADRWRDMLNTVLVSVPFTILAMSLLFHQRRLQRQLSVLATTDVLTGLLNRRAFLARATEAAEGRGAGALLILDADHFKRINDAHGHAAGDACLEAIAAHLRAMLRPGDVVGRLGGEEFAVFLPGATPDEAAAAGERLCRHVAFRAEGLEKELRVTLSAGATLASPSLPLSRLLAQADAALYRAKAEGRARVVLWSAQDRGPDGLGTARAA